MLNFNKQRVFCAIGAKEKIVLSAMQGFHNEEELVDVGGGNLGFNLNPVELVDETGLPYRSILNAIRTLTECGFITKVFLPGDYQHLWVINLNIVKELKTVKEIPDNISFKMDPSESVDVKEIFTLSAVTIILTVRSLDMISRDIDFGSKLVQSNLQLIGKKINPFDDGQISIKKIFKMATYILIYGIHSISTLDNDWGVYNSEELVVAKSNEILTNLEVVIPNPLEDLRGDCKDTILIKDCYETQMHESRAEVIMDSIPHMDIYPEMIIEKAFIQWIAMLSGEKIARVEYLLPPLHNLGYID